MKKTPQTSEKSAFTLIELLIVIAIIGILMSLLFPAVNSAIDAARKAQAKNDVTQIATAVIAYETEYGRLPLTNASDSIVAVSGNWLKALSGSNVDGLNPRQIVFLELQAAKKGKGGTNTSGEFVDPWTTSSAKNLYYASFDCDYDNRIKVSTNGGASGSVDVMKKVGIWNANTNTRQQVRSWE